MKYTMRETIVLEKEDIVEIPADAIGVTIETFKPLGFIIRWLEPVRDDGLMP